MQGPRSGWLPPGAASTLCHLGFLSASLCVISSWGLDKNVAPGLLRCLDYVGGFPVGESCASLSSPLGENAQEGGTSFRDR